MLHFLLCRKEGEDLQYDRLTETTNKVLTENLLFVMLSRDVDLGKEYFRRRMGLETMRGWC